MLDKNQAPPGRYAIKEPINVAGISLPQKVYRFDAFYKYSFLFFALIVFFMWAATAAGIGWGLTPGRLEVWLTVLLEAILVLSIILFVWFFYRVWRQRLEFSSDGVTIYFLFFCIYAPWENIAAYDKDARAPSAHGSYGGFVYKEPALLYVPLRKGKEEHVTVVQIPRLRARTNPELVAYLSHYLPLLPEVFPEKEFTTLFSAVTNKNE